MSDKCTDCGFDLVQIGIITKVCPKCINTRLIFAERRVMELEQEKKELRNKPNVCRTCNEVLPDDCPRCKHLWET